VEVGNLSVEHRAGDGAGRHDVDHLGSDDDLAIYNTRGKAVWNRHMVIGTLMPGSQIRGVDTAGRDVTMYSVNRVYTVQMRADGNLVLLRNGKTVLWSSNTTSWPNSSAWISPAGRFAVRNQNGLPGRRPPPAHPRPDDLQDAALTPSFQKAAYRPS
jgi:hypothetical protein